MTACYNTGHLCRDPVNIRKSQPIARLALSVWQADGAREVSRIQTVTFLPRHLVTRFLAEIARCKNREPFRCHHFSALRAGSAAHQKTFRFLGYAPNYVGRHRSESHRVGDLRLY